MTNHARQMGIQSSLHMPDKVLNFVKDHFLMDSVIRSAPLLLKRSVRYTQIAVHKIQGMERAYDVLFIGTGTVQQILGSISKKIKFSLSLTNCLLPSI